MHRPRLLANRQAHTSSSAPKNAERFGIDIAEWRVLATLAAGEPRSAQLIVRSTRTHKTRISRAVSRMIEVGLLERAGSDGDRRLLPLRRTERGRALCAKLVPLVLERERALMACLSDDERRCFTTALGKLERALGLGDHRQGSVEGQPSR